MEFPSRASSTPLHMQLIYYADYIPIASTVTNLTGMFVKCVTNLNYIKINYPSIKQNHYISHLKNKSYLQCALLLIPGINILVAVYWQPKFKGNHLQKVNLENCRLPGKQTLTPHIKGMVYIYHSDICAPIMGDRHCKFGTHLKDKDRKPIKIAPEDIYLTLRGEFVKGKNLVEQWSKNHNSSFILLPSSLFKNIKNGGVVQFYYDDYFVELTCNQLLHPDQQAVYSQQPIVPAKFEKEFKTMQNWIEECHIQPQWKEDIEGEFLFQGRVVVGRELYFPMVNKEQIRAESFKFYMEDQRKYAPYKQLLTLDHTDHIDIISLHKKNIQDLSEIHVIAARVLNYQHQLWVIVPHKPNLNQYPEGQARVEWQAKSGMKKVFTKSTFNPIQGDRLPNYHYGQYYMIPSTRPFKDVKYTFNAEGFLQITYQFA